MLKRIFFTAIIFSLSLAVFIGCKEKVGPGTSQVVRQQITGLEIKTVQPLQLDELYETSGTVKAKNVSQVSSRLMGSITSFKVKEGDRVSAGTVLLTIDDSDLQQKVKAAQEGYAEAKKGLEAARENRNLREITYQRYRKLFEEKALSQQELDQLETQKKVALLDYERAESAVKRVEAGLNEAKVFQAFAAVKSPSSGLVTEKKADAGSMAVPGMPLLTVEDTSSYRIELTVDEKYAGKVKPSMTAKIFIEALNKEIQGTVTDVVQAVDPMTRGFLVKVSAGAEGLRSGLYARVALPIGKKEAIALPKAAIVERGQLTGVYTVDASNVISYRLVRTGRSVDGSVEILSGIRSGDRVVISGTDRAVDGGIAVAGKQ